MDFKKSEFEDQKKITKNDRIKRSKTYQQKTQLQKRSKVSTKRSTKYQQDKKHENINTKININTWREKRNKARDKHGTSPQLQVKYYEFHELIPPPPDC